MKSSLRIIVFAVLAVTCFSGRLAYGGARPVIGSVFGIGLADAKTAIGADGIYRLVFDYNPASIGSPSSYSGSVLWLINPNGGVVGASSQMIPSTVGAMVYVSEAAPLSPPAVLSESLLPFERSNTAIFAQADGNTTVLFYYAVGALGFANTTSFATWTYNSSGALIAAAVYGPFSGVTLQNLNFDNNGYTVAKWQSGPLASASFAGWVLDEFGTVGSATSFFGPFGAPGDESPLGKIHTNNSFQQVWTWRFNGPGGTYQTNMWTFNSSGSAIVNSQSFGPF
jgi:hypothetical protein